jgi:hypothetical protein
VTQSVSVLVSSLYEAAAIAVAEFKKSGFAFIAVGPGTKLKIAVEAPTTIQELSVAKLQAWLDSNGRTPARAGDHRTLCQLLRRRVCQFARLKSVPS